MSNKPLDRCTVLVVDDDDVVLESLNRFVRSLDHIGLTAKTVEEAEKLLASHNVDIVITDIDLKSLLTGEDLLIKIMDEDTNLPVVVMSAHMPIEIEHRLLSLGARECLQKPFFALTCQQLIEQWVIPKKSYY